jgi:hypothetical protein
MTLNRVALWTHAGHPALISDRRFVGTGGAATSHQVRRESMEAVHANIYLFSCIGA